MKLAHPLTFCSLLAATSFAGAATYEFRVAAKGVTSAIQPLPKLLISRSEVDFGAVAGGASAEETVRLTNAGNVAAALSISHLSAPFALIHNCPATLEPAASCDLTGVFTPTQEGLAEGLIEVVATGSAAVQLSFVGSLAPALTIEGFGAYPDFGSVPVGRTIQRDYYIKNTSAQSVTISRPVVSGAGYSTLLSCMSTSTLTLAPGGFCRMRTQVSPGAATSYAGALSVLQYGGGASAQYAFNAVGVTPSYSSILTTDSALQYVNSTNWKVSMRAEVRIDEAAGLLVADAFLTSWGTGSVPGGDYGIKIEGPAGTSSARHKIVSHLSNVRVTDAVPVLPGNYVVGELADRYQLHFTVSAARRITAYSIVVNGVPTGSATLTQTPD